MVARPRLAYRPELDGIRGIAVLLVMAYHAGVPGFTLNAAYLGVVLFFVLSGYLITTLLLAERAATGRIDLRAFYVRRIRRLIPALVAVILVVGAVMTAAGRFDSFVPAAVAAIAYVADFTTAVFRAAPYLGHTWSLSLEEQFYVLWPVLVILVARRRGLAAIAVSGIVVVTALRVLLELTPWNHFQPEFRFDGVLWGCLLALVPFGRARGVRAAAWLALAAIAVSGQSIVLTLPAMAIASVGLVANADGSRILRAPWLVRVGTISYGLYLWHHPVAVVLGGSGGPIGIAAVFAISVGLALISERWFERPFRHRSPASPPDTTRSPAAG